MSGFMDRVEALTGIEGKVARIYEDGFEDGWNQAVDHLAERFKIDDCCWIDRPCEKHRAVDEENDPGEMVHEDDANARENTAYAEGYRDGLGLGRARDMLDPTNDPDDLYG